MPVENAVAELVDLDLPNDGAEASAEQTEVHGADAREEGAEGQGQAALPNETTTSRGTVTVGRASRYRRIPCLTQIR